MGYVFENVVRFMGRSLNLYESLSGNFVNNCKAPKALLLIHQIHYFDTKCKLLFYQYMLIPTCDFVILGLIGYVNDTWRTLKTFSLESHEHDMIGGFSKRVGIKLFQYSAMFET